MLLNASSASITHQGTGLTIICEEQLLCNHGSQLKKTPNPIKDGIFSHKQRKAITWPRKREKILAILIQPKYGKR
jgi:hypothetical protein